MTLALRTACAAAVVIAIAAPAAGQSVTARPALVSSSSGVNLNAFVGADAFYAAGYTGGRAVLLNVEGGHIWNAHDVHLSMTTVIDGAGSVSRAAGWSNALSSHATSVGHVMGGRPNPSAPTENQRGVGFGATLWSGSIARVAQPGDPADSGPNGSSFEVTTSTLGEVYRAGTRTGLNGATADVLNNSWGYDGDAAARQFPAFFADAFARSGRKAIVFAAGNDGGQKVSGGAAGYNAVSVAALSGESASPRYDTRSFFSSAGVSDTFVPAAATGATGTTVAGSRVRVDIAAPGEGFALARYFTGAPSNAYGSGQAGTSFAAPMVSGGLALMADAARANTLAQGTDPRVLKAVLLTTADKTAGWDNGQAVTNGAVVTTRALDPGVGAGRMNLAAALPYFASAAATRDVPGTAAGVQPAVAAAGWDYGRVTASQATDYPLADPVRANTRFTVTLTWFANRTIDEAALTAESAAENALANLDLQVFKLSAGGGFDTLVAASTTGYNTVEHLSFTTPEDAKYGLRVRFAGTQWDFVGTTEEFYGLAWATTPVPEPAWGLLVAAVVVARRRVTARRGK